MINIEWNVFHIRLMRSKHCLFGPLKSFCITFHSSCHRMIQDITYCWWAHPSRKGGLFFFHGHWWGISDISGFASGWDRKVCAMPVTSSVAWGNYWNRCDRRLDQLAAVKCAAFVARPGGPGSTWEEWVLTGGPTWFNFGSRDNLTISTYLNSSSSSLPNISQLLSHGCRSSLCRKDLWAASDLSWRSGSPVGYTYRTAQF